MTTDASARSKVLGEKNLITKGKQSCRIDFVYSGSEPENLFWDEPCAKVSARMVNRGFLEKFDKWERLESFERGYVEALPDGQVLYVEGSFSASIYPVADTGTIEVSVAD